MPCETVHGSRRPGAASRDNPNQQQAPWRSSLDLVWSYSRSQAFYGDNIATSPSFVERHWAGKDLEEGDSISTEDGLDQDDLSDEYESDDRASRYNDDSSFYNNENPFDPYNNQDWEGENLPPNAVAQTRKDKARAKDRRISRIETEHDQERSRSRSRSPKRLGAVLDLQRREPSHASRLNPGTSALRTGSGFSASERPLRDPYADSQDDKEPSGESAPLMASKRHVHTSPTRRRSSAGYGAIPRASSSGYSSSGSHIFGQGTSTFLQSWFNTLNALVGVGILALPLAFSYAGWFGGVVLFLICGMLTNYTGKVLARIMWKEPTLRTYADIGSYAFGPKARLLVSLFFCLELWAVSVALIILFGDSMAAIFTSVPAAAFKALGFAIVLPTIFLPLKFLSPISVIGIISTITLVVVVVSDGLVKKDAPGSLWQPAPTGLGPQWNRLPLSFGLIMSGFSSHPVIPSLVKDMKDPRQFPRMLNLAYLAATVIYLTTGMVGYAMFGSSVSDEITRDLAKTKGFPVMLTKIAIWLIVINPLAKFALATRPIQTTFEILLGLDANPPPATRAQAIKRRNSSGLSIKQRTSNGQEIPSKPSKLDTKTSNGHGTPTRPPRSPGSSGARLSAPAGPLDESNEVPGSAANDSENPLAGSAISLQASRMTAGLSPRFKLVLRVLLSVLLTALITVTAILLPGFEKVMAFLGAFLAFATCVFGPLLANLKLFGKEMKRWRIALDIFILTLSLVMAGTGTVWAFLPIAKQ